jgi:hypothetical protein
LFTLERASLPLSFLPLHVATKAAAFSLLSLSLSLHIYFCLSAPLIDSSPLSDTAYQTRKSPLAAAAPTTTAAAAAAETQQHIQRRGGLLCNETMRRCRDVSHQPRSPFPLTSESLSLLRMKRRRRRRFLQSSAASSTHLFFHSCIASGNNPFPHPSKQGWPDEKYK